MTYRSTISDRMNGSEDIWIVLDEDERIEAVYYMDLAQERAVVTGRGAGEPGADGGEVEGD